MTNSEITNLTQQLREFAEERDWDQFHSPKNLSKEAMGQALVLTP